MDLSSWFRRTLSRTSSKKTQNQNPSTKSNSKLRPTEEEEREVYGVTKQLVDHIKSFTLDTFKNLHLRDEEEATTTYEDETTRSSSATANVRKDLSEWQEKHAVIVLSKVKELSQLRFKLCPGHLKEQQFWRIYFKLVIDYLTEYELRAIQLAKLRRMAMDDNDAIPVSSGYEVEMSETTKQADTFAA